MRITLNGEVVEKQIEVLADLVEPTPGIAVALNEEVIPKTQWSTVEIHEGDRIEIITPFQGG